MNYDFILNKNKYIFSSGSAMELVNEKVKEERIKESSLFIRDLKLYSVSLKELTNERPSYKERNELLNIALNLTHSKGLLKELLSLRKLNISKLSKASGYIRRYLEKWSGYIIAYVLLANNPNYQHLQDYLSIAVSTPESSGSLIVKDNSTKNQGLVIKEHAKGSIILTSQGEFIFITPEERGYLGTVALGSRKKEFSDYKKAFWATTIAVLLIFISGIIYYNMPKSTVIISHGSKYTMTINSFDRVISTTAPNQNLRKIVDNAGLKNKVIDKAMIRLLDTLSSEELLTKDSPMTIIISGEGLEYEALTESRNYLKEKGIVTSINNAGKEYKIN